MSRKRPATDADGMALHTTPKPSKPEAAMEFFNPSQYPWSDSKLPLGVVSLAGRGKGGAGKLDCGWYDSSFDLARGLEVSEQDNDTIYQLWELSQY
jgi:hypothetical protein